MISENGESHISRPDRILRSDEGYIIVDFKTGEQKAKMKPRCKVIKTFLKDLVKGS